MTRLIYCLKLKKEAEGLKSRPYPGPLGEYIFNHISLEAWQLWLKHQTMLINEHKLVLSQTSARQFLVEELQKFFEFTVEPKPPS